MRITLQMFLIMLFISSSAFAAKSDDRAFIKAAENGTAANEGLIRCRNFVTGWLKYADPETGLIPKNLGWEKYTSSWMKDGFDVWNISDSAADNYPFMVLTAAITDRALYSGRMLDILNTEKRITSRIGTLPDAYVFSKRGFYSDEPKMSSILFGASEYIKDGLMPITEWLGRTPWCERMMEMLDDVWAHASVKTEYGDIISESNEVNGEMLQVLSRVYWMAGDEKYLNWALRLGDYYLQQDGEFSPRLIKLRLSDHGCEIVSGLCELYATLHFTAPEKKEAYRKPLHRLLDRILEIGRNEHGLLYNWINLETGENSGSLCDTWGYNYNGLYAVYLVDGTEAYRRAVRQALVNLNKFYKNYPWGPEDVLADQYADSIEGALNLFNREAIPSVAEWLDSEIRVMWNIQKPDGVIEGWHGDGNFARTTIMYCLWKTQGVTIEPWRDDIVFGAVHDGTVLKLSIKSGKEWNGRIIFDKPRFSEIMKMPLDWPRINQFPEWFTVTSEDIYTINDLNSNEKTKYSGSQMSNGISLHLEPDGEKRFIIK